MTLSIAPERIALHLDASDATTLTLDSNDRVTEWRDKNGNGINFSAVPGYGMPLKINNAVRFDPPSISSSIYNSSLARILRHNGSVLDSYPIDIFALSSNVNNPNNHIGPIISGSNNTTSYEFLFQRGLVHRNGPWNQQNVAADWSGGKWNLLHATLISTKQTVRAQIITTGTRATATRVPIANYSYLGTERPAIGLYPAYQFNGDLHELIVIKNATESERTIVNHYIADKWPLAMLAPVSSRAIDLRGLPDPRVVIFDWGDPDNYTVPVFTDDGNWQTTWPKNIPFGIYYLSHDDRCPPICHGPYEITE